MKRFGPDLRLPKFKRPQLGSGAKGAAAAKSGGLKLPPFATHLYEDLRDRRLLPLVALVLVAIIAVPFLLGSGSEESEGSEPPAISRTAQPPANASLTVIEAQPGLRAPSKRLAGRTATDPFLQRYTGSIRDGGLPNEEATTTTSPEPRGTAPGGITGTSSPAPTTPGGSGGSNGSNGSNDKSGGGDQADDEPPEDQVYTFTVDVQIARSEEQPDGSQIMGEPKTRKGVKSPQPLPGEKAPVVTYVGVNFVDRDPRALLMVSREVNAVFGDAKCVSGDDSCELLEVEPGFPEIFEYGPNDVRYKLKITRIDLVRDGQS